MGRVKITRAELGGGREVWAMSHDGDGDPVADLDAAQRQHLSGLTHEMLASLPEEPGMRLYRVDAAQDDGARPNTVSMELRTGLGNLTSTSFRASDSELETILSLSKTYHQDGTAFEMWTDSGFVVVPPEVVRTGILTINIKRDDDEVQDP